MAIPPQIICPACGTANQAQNTICSSCGLTLPTPPQPILLLTPNHKQVEEGASSTTTVSSNAYEQYVDLSSLEGYQQTPGYAPSTVPPMPTSEEIARMVSQPPSKHGISRRTVIIGLVSLGVAATAGITLYTLAQRGQIGVFAPSPALFTYRGHSLEVMSVAWSPDGKRIVSTSFDETAQVWEPLTGKQFVIFRGQNGAVIDATWSPDGSRIASCGSGPVQIWDANTGNVSLSYHGHTHYANAVAWSPDSKRIASASGYYPTGTTDNTVQVWDATTGDHPYIYNGHSGPVTGVTWSPDGKYLASSSADKTVQVWQAP